MTTKTKDWQPPAKGALNEAAVEAEAGTTVLRQTRRAGTTTARRVSAKSAAEKKTRQMLVHLTDIDIRDLKVQAAYERRTVSAIVADAVRAYLVAHPVR